VLKISGVMLTTRKFPCRSKKGFPKIPEYALFVILNFSGSNNEAALTDPETSSG
jgi:hypothetical protein